VLLRSIVGINKSKIELTGEEGGPIKLDTLAKLSDEQLAQLEGIVRALHEIEGEAQVAKRLLNLDGPLNKT
jgi:hypothetical protein